MPGGHPSYRATISRIARSISESGGRNARQKARYLLRKLEAEGVMVCSRDVGQRREYRQARRIVLNVQRIRAEYVGWAKQQVFSYFIVPRISDLDSRTIKANQGRVRTPKFQTVVRVMQSTLDAIEAEVPDSRERLLLIGYVRNLRQVIGQFHMMGLSSNEVARAVVRLKPPVFDNWTPSEIEWFVPRYLSDFLAPTPPTALRPWAIFLHEKATQTSSFVQEVSD